MLTITISDLFRRVGTCHAFRHPEAKSDYVDAMIGFLTATDTNPASSESDLLARQQFTTRQWMDVIEEQDGDSVRLEMVGDWFSHATEWAVEYDKSEAAGQAAMAENLAYYRALFEKGGAGTFEKLEQAILSLLFMYQADYDQHRVEKGDRKVEHTGVTYTTSHRMYNVLKDFKCTLAEYRKARIGQYVDVTLSDFAESIGHGKVTNITVTTPHPNQVQPVPVRMILRLMEMCDEVVNIKPTASQNDKLAYGNLDAILRTALRMLCSYNFVIEKEHGLPDEKVSALIELIADQQQLICTMCDGDLHRTTDANQVVLAKKMRKELVGALVKQDCVSKYKMTVLTEWLIHRDYARFLTRARARAVNRMVDESVKLYCLRDEGGSRSDMDAHRDNVIASLEAVGFFVEQADKSWEGTDVDGKPANDDKTVAMNVFGSKMELVRSLLDDFLERFNPADLQKQNGQRKVMLGMLARLYVTWESFRSVQESYLKDDPKKSVLIELNQIEAVGLQRRILSRLIACFSDQVAPEVLLRLNAMVQIKSDAEFYAQFRKVLPTLIGSDVVPKGEGDKTAELAGVLAQFNGAVYSDGGALIADFDVLRKGLLARHVSSETPFKLSAKQLELLDMWQTHLRINNNMRLSRSQYRQEGTMHRLSRELIQQQVGQASAEALDVGGLDGDIVPKWGGLKAWGATGSPVMELKKSVLDLFERVAAPNATTKQKQVTESEVDALQGSIQAVISSGIGDKALHGRLQEITKEVAFLHGQTGVDTIQRLGRIWDQIHDALYLAQATDTRAFVNLVLAPDSGEVKHRDLLVRYACMMANQSLTGVMQTLSGPDGELMRAVRAHEPALPEELVAKLQRRLERGMDVRAHVLLMGEIADAVTRDSALGRLLQEYDAIYHAVVHVKKDARDAAFDAANIEFMPFPDQVKRNLMSMRVVATEPAAFDSLLISLFRDFRDISSVMYEAEVLGIPSHLVEPVPLFEDPDIIDPKEFVARLNEFKAAFGHYPKRVMFARSDGQRQGGRIAENSAMAELMQVLSILGIEIENGGGPTPSRGGTYHDNWTHTTLAATTRRYTTTVQGEDRSRFNTMQRANATARADLTGNIRTASQVTLDESARGTKARDSVDLAQDAVASVDGLDGEREWWPDFIEGDVHAQSIHQLCVDSWKEFYEQLVTNPDWDVFVSAQTPHGMKFPTSSRTQDRPRIGGETESKTLMEQWRAITAVWNVLVPGFNYHVFSAKFLYPKLKAYAADHLGREDKWVEFVSEMMDRSPFIAKMWTSVGAYVQHEASEWGPRAFAKLGDKGEALIKEFESSYVEARTMTEALDAYQKERLESVRKYNEGVREFNATCSISEVKKFLPEPQVLFDDQGEKEQAYLAFRFLTAFLLGEHRFPGEGQEKLDSRLVVASMALLRVVQTSSRLVTAAT